MKKILIVLLAVAVLAASGIALAGVGGTPHDIGTITGGGEPCAFCHTPHQGSISQYPLWNRSQSTQTYGTYSSNTFEMGVAVKADLDNGSAPCMVCHNGVLSVLVNYPGRGSTPQAYYNLDGTSFTNAWANLGTDLQNEHPVSFTYDAGLDAQNNGFPTNVGGIITGVTAGTEFPLFDPAGASATPTEFGCATCHTVHHTPVTPYSAGVTGGEGEIYEVYFLKMTNTSSAMCAECHANRY